MSAIGNLATIAPRLSLARDQYVVALVRARAGRRHARRKLMSAEQLTAHRDLQLVRAWGTGDAKYIRHRERKLAAAVRELARAQARVERLESEGST